MPPKQPPSPSTPPPPGPMNLLSPLRIIFYSAYYLLPTILHLLLSLQLRTLFSWPLFKEVWFANFWSFFGPRSRENAAPKVTPLLANNASGVCLDIGPGSGQWLYLFARAQNPSIRKIYGVEPNRDLHGELRANAIRAGLGDVYEIIGCGAEELETKGGVERGTIDTIVTVQCLCSIPTPEVIIKELYPLLRGGGKWLVYEHVRTKYRGEVVEYWQKALNLIWPHFLGGCDITRPTDEWLLQAGEWEKVDLRPGVGEGPYDTVPHVIGHLVKKRDAFEPLN